MTRRHFPDSKIWANSANEITDPNAARWANAYENGAGATPPDAGVHNYVFNRSDEQHQHIEQNGIPRWLTDTEYADGGLALGSDNVIYQSQGAANQGNDPTTDNGTNWLPLPSVNLLFDPSGSTLTSENPEDAIKEVDDKVENLAASDIEVNDAPLSFSATETQEALEQLDGLINRIIEPYKLSFLSYGYVKDVSAEMSDVSGLTISPDGATVFVVDQVTPAIVQYDLSTPFKLDTASYSGQEFDLSAQINSGETTGITYGDNGTYIYVTEELNNSVQRYVLTTPWDLSTISHDEDSGTFNEVTSIHNLAWKKDGTKFFVLSNGDNTIYEYNTSNWSVLNVGNDADSYDLSGEFGTSAVTDIFLDPEYRYLFVLGTGQREAYAYELWGRVPQLSEIPGDGSYTYQPKRIPLDDFARNQISAFQFDEQGRWAYVLSAQGPSSGSPEMGQYITHALATGF